LFAEATSVTKSTMSSDKKVAECGFALVTIEEETYAVPEWDVDALPIWAYSTVLESQS